MGLNVRFIRRSDSSILSKTSDGGRPSVDHQLTIDMAKELCMIQRTDIGRRIRQYFIRVEKERHQYSPMLQELMALEMQQKSLAALYYGIWKGSLENGK